MLRTHLLGQRDFEKIVLINVVALAPWGSPFFAHIRQHEAAFSGVPAYIHRAIVETYIQGALYNQLDLGEMEALVQPWLGDVGQAAFYRQIAQASQKYTDEQRTVNPTARLREDCVYQRCSTRAVGFTVLCSCSPARGSL